MSEIQMCIAKREHRCDDCADQIEIGDRFHRVFQRNRLVRQCHEVCPIDVSTLDAIEADGIDVLLTPEERIARDHVLRVRREASI